MMHLEAISIVREGFYVGSYQKSDPSKPLRCTVQVAGPMGKTELNLPTEASERIIALISAELAEQTRRVAEVMTTSFIEHQPATPLIEG